MFKLLKQKISDSKIGFFHTVIFIFNRGVIPAFRGAIFKLFHLDFSPKVLFLGKGTAIHHYSKFIYGNNCYIGDHSYFNFLSVNGVKFGHNVTIREFAWLQLSSSLKNPGDTIIIGNGTYIGPRCNLGAAAPLVIGNKCQIGAGVSFIAENHQFEAGKDIYSQGVTRQGITVGDDCWIGNNVVILDGVTVGKGVVIGAGSVVTKSIPDFTVVAGVPAKLIKNRS